MAPQLRFATQNANECRRKDRLLINCHDFFNAVHSVLETIKKLHKLCKIFGRERAQNVPLSLSLSLSLSLISVHDEETVKREKMPSAVHFLPHHASIIV